VLDCWPQHGRIVVRPGPLKSLHAARFYDLNGNAHAIDTQGFVPDYAGSVLAFVPWAVPMPGRATAGIELDVKIGFGDTIEDVPEPLRQAIRLLVSHLRREFRHWTQRQSAAANSRAARQHERRHR
jgi:uncharacterized phiE125 gp8 family phage protein